ncbi:MAG: restriction endonuclease subunit S, partial [Oscillospiraceae bacterium]|nr:restriction endonuclease subunit S [Oscillospiraceae bacterium]
MSRLQELIKELCPDGVEYVKIRDYFTRLKGTPITAQKMKEIAKDDGKIKIFAGGKTVINANEEDIPKANITKIPAVLVQSRGIIDVIYCENPFTFKNEMWAYTHENQITVKYLYYVMKKDVLYFRDCASGMGSLPQISLKVTEDLKIPLPPLVIQEEIVRILDSFTEYTALLEKELELRKKQYAYYRDMLLNFESEGTCEFEWKTLGEVATFLYGFTDKAKDNGQARYLRITDISDDGYLLNHEKKYINITEENKKYLINAGDVLVARTGASYGKTLYFSGKEQSIFASFLIKIVLDN